MIRHRDRDISFIYINVFDINTSRKRRTVSLGDSGLSSPFNGRRRKKKSKAGQTRDFLIRLSLSLFSNLPLLFFFSSPS